MLNGGRLSVVSFGALTLFLASTASALASEVRTGPSSTYPVFRGRIQATLKSGTVATFVASNGRVTCNQSRVQGDLTGKNTAGDVIGDVDVADWTNSGSQWCPTTFPFNPRADLTALNLPWNNTRARWLSATSGSRNGTITIDDFSPVDVKVRVALSNGVSCVYRAASVVGDLFNPNNSDRLVFSNDAFTKESGSSFCSSSGTLNATYLVRGQSSPGSGVFNKPLYIVKS